jgi:ubiquinone/menaquinone biosynthesis C-methylase UbiE
MRMKFINKPRVPLREDQFIDIAAVRFYDEHARRFMMPIYHGLVAKTAKINLPEKRVLDIGTGSGILAIELAKAHPDWQIIGIDISDNMLKIARENAAREGLGDDVEFWQYSAEALPFEDDFFGLVVSNASLHLWTNPIKVFKEIARVTARQGYCLIWDNLRLTVFNSLLNLAGGLMGMKTTQRRLWLQAIHASYTNTEAKALIDSSALQDARVKINTRLLELCIQWRKH